MNKTLVNMVNEHKIAIFFCLFISFFISGPLMRPEYFWGHEREFIHYRVNGILLAWEGGQLPAKVLPNLVNSFGYGWNIFYAPLSYTLTATLVKIGLSIDVAIKIFHFMTFFISGIGMYYCVMRFKGCKTAAILSAVLYMSAPYRLVDVYLRNAYAEAAAFMFLPFMAISFFEMMQGNKKSWIMFSFSCSGLLLTHNITSLYSVVFLLISGLAIIIHNKGLKKETVVSLALSALFVVLLTSYFIVPMLQHKFLGQYMAFTSFSPSAEVVQRHAVYLGQLVSGSINWGGSIGLDDTVGEMPYYIGLPLLMFGIVPLISVKNKLYAFSFSCFILSVVIMMPWFPWNHVPSIFYYIQFPWRMLTFAIFFLALCASFIPEIMIKDKEASNNVNIVSWGVLIVAAFLSLNTASPYLNSVNYRKITHDLNFERVGEGSIVGTSVSEYLPMNAIQSKAYELEEGQTARINVLTGEANVNIISNSNGNIRFDIQVLSTDAIIELPLIYYIGYRATLINSSGSTNFEIYESESGLVALNVSNSGIIEVRYTGTLLGMFSSYVSLVSLIALIICSRKGLFTQMGKSNYNTGVK